MSYSIQQWKTAVMILKKEPEAKVISISERLGLSWPAADRLIKDAVEVFNIKRTVVKVPARGKRTGIDYMMAKIYRTGIKKPAASSLASGQ